MVEIVMMTLSEIAARDVIPASDRRLGAGEKHDKIPLGFFPPEPPGGRRAERIVPGVVGNSDTIATVQNPAKVASRPSRPRQNEAAMRAPIEQEVIPSERPSMSGLRYSV